MAENRENKVLAHIHYSSFFFIRTSNQCLMIVQDESVDLSCLFSLFLPRIMRV